MFRVAVVLALETLANINGCANSHRPPYEFQQLPSHLLLVPPPAFASTAGAFALAEGFGAALGVAGPALAVVASSGCATHHSAPQVPVCLQRFAAVFPKTFQPQ